MAVATEGVEFLPLSNPCRWLTRVRSTLLVAGISTLRREGHYDAYVRALPAAYHTAVLGAVAGVWVPLEVAEEHYRACDSLGLSDEASVRIGRLVGEQLRGTISGAVIRLTKEAGVTPWMVMERFPTFWNRLFDGSGLAGRKLGPKEARLDLVRMPLCASRYFRHAIRGQAMFVLDLFCAKSYMAELSNRRNEAGTYSFRVQWA